MDPNGQVYGDVEERVPQEDVERLASAEREQKLRDTETRLKRAEGSKISRAEGKVPRGGEAK